MSTVFAALHLHLYQSLAKISSAPLQFDHAFVEPVNGSIYVAHKHISAKFKILLFLISSNKFGKVFRSFYFSLFLPFAFTCFANEAQTKCQQIFFSFLIKTKIYLIIEQNS